MKGSMAKRSEKTVLFLGAGSDYRSRFAEMLFNSVSLKIGLPWRALSRGLADKHGVVNSGPMPVKAVAALKSKGIREDEAMVRPPTSVTTDDLEQAALIVALENADDLPRLHERLPGWSDEVEFWSVDDTPEAMGQIEREVMSPVARLLGGSERPTSQPTEVSPASSQEKAPAKKSVTLKVGRETAGRRGKGVTTVFDLPLDEARVQELASLLKQRCGTGGTVKNGRIEIQGDQRERIVTELEKLGYKVKRVGG
jgi:translation initiation factor 1